MHHETANKGILSRLLQGQLESHRITGIGAAEKHLRPEASSRSSGARSVAPAGACEKWRLSVAIQLFALTVDCWRRLVIRHKLQPMAEAEHRNCLLDTREDVLNCGEPDEQDLENEFAARSDGDLHRFLDCSPCKLSLDASRGRIKQQHAKLELERRRKKRSRSWRTQVLSVASDS